MGKTFKDNPYAPKVIKEKRRKKPRVKRKQVTEEFLKGPPLEENQGT